MLPVKSRARRRRPGRSQSGRTPEFGYEPLRNEDSKETYTKSKISYGLSGIQFYQKD